MVSCCPESCVQPVVNAVSQQVFRESPKSCVQADRPAHLKPECGTGCFCPRVKLLTSDIDGAQQTLLETNLEIQVRSWNRDLPLTRTAEASLSTIWRRRWSCWSWRK